MITTLKWLPRRAVLLMIAVLVAVALAVELAHPSSARSRYGLADNGVIHGYGIQGTGAVQAGHSGTASSDDNGVIHSD
jgi:hypothetical protein